MATLNIGMKVNRAISGADTVSANAYAMVTYRPTNIDFSGNVGDFGGAANAPVITRYFGPEQSIPATFVTGIALTGAGGFTGSTTVTYALLSGVELVNTQ